jgi:hypothetical protein
MMRESDDDDSRDYHDSDYHDSDDDDENVGKNDDKMKMTMVLMMTIIMIKRGILVTSNHRHSG